MMRTLLALSLFLTAPPAVAHQGPNAATAIFLRDGALLGGGTTWGIVLKEGDQWLRVCEEAFGQSPTFHVRLADGRILLGGNDGLYETKDKGCSYGVVDDTLEGVHVTSFATASAALDVAALTTSTLGQPNGVRLSGDGAQSFADTSIVYDDIVFDTVRLSADATLLFATGYDTAESLSVIVFSPDRGETHQLVELPDYTRVRLLAVDDGIAMASALLPTGGSKLVEFDTDLNIVAESDSFLQTVSDYARVGEDRYITLNRNAVHVSRAGGAFEEVADAPSNCLVTSAVGSPLWACGQLRHFAHFFSLEDDGTFTSYVGFGEVVERECPDGTPGAAFCVYPSFDGGVGSDAGDPEVDGGGDGDGDDDEIADDCGCAAGGDSIPLIALGGLLALMWRRPRRES